MSTFGQLIEDVYVKTNRPDLEAETNLAVRQATQFFHLKDFWKRDCEERLLTFTAAAFLFSISINNTLERFRKIRYIKKFDFTAQTPIEGECDKISECDPDHLFDRYNAIKKNIFYIAGSNLNLRLNTQESGLLVAWYRYPVVASQENFSSWIADMYPSAIVNLAAGYIQRDIGLTDDANRREKWAIEIDYPLIAAQDIEATAR